MKRSQLLPELGKKTYVMGILNLTTDSFSGDGLLTRPSVSQAALEQAGQFIEAGADILDLGAESTRPGYISVSAQEEIERLVPVIQSLRKCYPHVLLSIDTYKASVAAACLAEGAQIINDVWGFKYDAEMAGVVQSFGATAVLMHNRTTPKSTQQTELGGRYVEVKYKDVVAAVLKGLGESLAIAQEAGIPDDRLVIDPGIGFAKTTEHNLELLKKMDELEVLGYPILLGISRKSFIGYTLNLPPKQRLEGSLAANAWGVMHGADILRVHDVRETVLLARMLDAIRLS